MTTDGPSATAPQRAWLSRIAAANVVLHLAVLGAAAWWLRPAGATATLAERTQRFADPGNVLLWRFGWALWIAAAAGSVGFVVVLSRFVPPGVTSARAARAAIVAAAAIHLIGDTLQAVLVPRLAGHGVPGWVFEPVAAVLSGIGTVAANTLGSVAVVLVTSALGKLASPVARATAWLTFVAGMLLALAGILEQPGLLGVAAPVTILALCSWTAVAAHGVIRRLPPPVREVP